MGDDLEHETKPSSASTRAPEMEASGIFFKQPQEQSADLSKSVTNVRHRSPRRRTDSRRNDIRSRSMNSSAQRQPVSHSLSHMGQMWRASRKGSPTKRGSRRNSSSYKKTVKISSRPQVVQKELPEANPFDSGPHSESDDDPAPSAPMLQSRDLDRMENGAPDDWVYDDESFHAPSEQRWSAINGPRPRQQGALGWLGGLADNPITQPILLGATCTVDFCEVIAGAGGFMGMVGMGCNVAALAIELRKRDLLPFWRRPSDRPRRHSVGDTRVWSPRTNPQVRDRGRRRSR